MKWNKNWASRVAAFKAFHESPISSKTCAFCSFSTALSGIKVRAVSHFPSASRNFPSFKKRMCYENEVIKSCVVEHKSIAAGEQNYCL